MKIVKIYTAVITLFFYVSFSSCKKDAMKSLNPADSFSTLNSVLLDNSDTTFQINGWEKLIVTVDSGSITNPTNCEFYIALYSFVDNQLPYYYNQDTVNFSPLALKRYITPLLCLPKELSFLNPVHIKWKLPKGFTNEPGNQYLPYKITYDLNNITTSLIDTSKWTTISSYFYNPSDSTVNFDIDSFNEMYIIAKKTF